MTFPLISTTTTGSRTIFPSNDILVSFSHTVILRFSMKLRYGSGIIRIFRHCPRCIDCRHPISLSYLGHHSALVCIMIIVRIILVRVDIIKTLSPAPIGTYNPIRIAVTTQSPSLTTTVPLSITLTTTITPVLTITSAPVEAPIPTTLTTSTPATLNLQHLQHLCSTKITNIESTGTTSVDTIKTPVLISEPVVP